MTSDRPSALADRARRTARRLGRSRPWRRRSEAILFDREGTLVTRVPDGGDPASMRAMPGAADALAAARAAGVAVGVVTGGTSGRPESSQGDAERVNARVSELVGPVDVWVECPHGDDEECPCRVPAPGLIFLAAAALGTRPERCVVVGDVGADVEAARAAGARAVLVPSSRTTPEEIDAAPVVAASLEEAVELALGKAA